MMQCSYKEEVQPERINEGRDLHIFSCMLAYQDINFFSNAFADDCVRLQPSMVLYTIKHGLLGNASENCHPLKR